MSGASCVVACGVGHVVGHDGRVRRPEQARVGGGPLGSSGEWSEVVVVRGDLGGVGHFGPLVDVVSRHHAGVGHDVDFEGTGIF